MESDLVAAQKVVADGVEALKTVEEENEAARAEAERLRGEGEVAEAKHQEAKQENALLKNEIEELRSGFTA